MKVRLAIDTTSPRTTLALGGPAQESVLELQQRQTSRRLIGAIDQILGEVPVSVSDLEGILVLAGPGSLTGVRIGLATVLGLHLATQVPALALSTLEVKAWAASADTRVLSAVYAMRDEWFVQPFWRGVDHLEALAPPSLCKSSDLAQQLTAHKIDRAVGPWDTRSSLAASQIDFLNPPSLAVLALSLFENREPEWNSQTLERGNYMREAFTTKVTGGAAG